MTKFEDYGGIEADIPTYRVKPTWINKNNNRISNVLFFNLGIYDTFEQGSISVTTNSSGITYANNNYSHLIKNIGSVVCFVNLGETATSSNISVYPNESIVIYGESNKISAITSSGTTTLKIIAQSMGGE